MQRIVIMLLVCFVAATRGECADRSLSARLGEVSLGQLRADVEMVLGKPLRVVHTGDALDPQLNYPGFVVWFWKGRGVTQIKSTDDKYCTSSGVCPGMTMKEASKLHGLTVTEQHLQEGMNEYLLIDAETCWMDITVQKMTVQQLEIKCQP